MGGGGEVADFVEEEGAPIGDFGASEAALGGPSEGTAFVAKELALDEGFGESGAVEGDKGAAFAGGEFDDGARDEFLAGAGAAADEDGGIGGGDLADLFVDLAHFAAGADHIAGGMLEEAAQAEIFLQEEHALFLLMGADFCDICGEAGDDFDEGGGAFG